MYKFSVGAIFRNESHGIKEWIEHYLLHGAEHFYLINDESNDNTVETIQPYIDANIVTLFNPTWPRYLGRQRDMYTKYILPHLKESKWLLMADIDEYMWSQIDINLCKPLEQCVNLGQVQVRETLFGSNGHIEQPAKIVESFTKCATMRNSTKYFVNSDYEFTHLNVHHATFLNKEHEQNNFLILGDEYFILNHYCCQSFNFWRDVKCTRNDSDSYRTRLIEDFVGLDFDQMEDLRLAIQNNPPLEKVEPKA